MIFIASKLKKINVSVSKNTIKIDFLRAFLFVLFCFFCLCFIIVLMINFQIKRSSFLSGIFFISLGAGYRILNKEQGNTYSIINENGEVISVVSQ